MNQYEQNTWVCLKMLAKPRKSQWFCWSDNPVLKWLFHWEYALFSDKPIWKFPELSRWFRFFRTTNGCRSVGRCTGWLLVWRPVEGEFDISAPALAVSCHSWRRASITDYHHPKLSGNHVKSNKNQETSFFLLFCVCKNTIFLWRWSNASQVAYM